MLDDRLHAGARRTTLFVVTLAAACTGSDAKPPPETAKNGPSDPAQPQAEPDPPAPDQTPAPGLDPLLAEHPPPPGVRLPTVGKVREVSPKAAHTAYDWNAVYEVDPADPAVAALVEDGSARDAGDAGALLYRREVADGGGEVTPYGCGFAYPIDDGKRTVMVVCSEQFHQNDPTGFSISVGPTGG